MPFPSPTLLPSVSLLPNARPIPLNRVIIPDVSDYSGIVINQNAVPADVVNDHTTLSSAYTYEVFTLPSDFTRGQNHRTPLLTGFSTCMKVSSKSGAFDWTFQEADYLGGWSTIARGTFSEPIEEGFNRVWCDVHFTDPLSVSATDYFRIGIKSRTAGIDGWNYSVPPTKGVHYAALGDGSPLIDASTSYMFRVLASVADEGTDFLGNRYRSMVVTSSPLNLDTADSNLSNNIWLSKPNPSRFAVESLYFDVRQNGASGVVDSVLIDPVTPDLSCTIYYAAGGSPGTTDTEWEERIWTPCTTIKLRRAETYALPHPIAADWIKLEFSNLQLRTYTAPPLQKPITYKKFPKWVYDHFVARIPDRDFTAKLVSVTHDAYDLAFQTYDQDLKQDPDLVGDLDESRQRVNTVDAQEQQIFDQIDPQTGAGISVDFHPQRLHPALRGIGKTILSDRLVTDPSRAYPVEQESPKGGISTLVSSTDRDKVVDQHVLPPMRFFIPARHRYKVVQATLPQEKAFFASLRQVAFMREHFAAESDAPVYNEAVGDLLNMERSDFYVSEDFNLTTYDTRTG